MSMNLFFLAIFTSFENWIWILFLYCDVTERSRVTVFIRIMTLCAWTITIKHSARAMHHMFSNHFVQNWVLLVWEIS
jgi:hypothetical protein